MVWYWANGTILPSGIDVYNDAQCAALVAFVHSDSMLNLCVSDQNGVSFPATSVRLLQEGDEIPPRGTHYCSWMPYQVGQANKERTTDEEAAKLKALARDLVSNEQATQAAERG